MVPWQDRPREEANLFNPAFCGALISEFANEFYKARKRGPHFLLAFCALPIALHPDTRRSLPYSIRTSMYSWIEQNPKVSVGFAQRAYNLVPYVQEAIRFALTHRGIDINELAEFTIGDNRVLFSRRFAQDLTPETNDVIHATRLVGRWFAAAGSAAVILSSWGLRS
jgi:hypothetical protein